MSADTGEDQVALTFREQADGRKVARLPSGKVVLVALEAVAKVTNGERWLVRLEHRDTFAVAYPLDKLPPPPVAAPPPLPRESLPGTLLGPAAPKPPAAAQTMSTVRVHAAPATPASAPMVALVATAPSAVVHMGDAVALFVDGANMDHAAREAGFFVDFVKARRYFQGAGTTYAAFYFSADFTAVDPMQRGFLDALSHGGYVVRKKPVKAIEDQETGETKYKCNLDTEVVVELLNTADNYDVAFLFTGDSDYERVVDVLRSRGKRVYVVSSRGSLSRELAYVADKPIFYIEDHRAHLERAVPTSGP